MPVFGIGATLYVLLASCSTSHVLHAFSEAIAHRIGLASSWSGAGSCPDIHGPAPCSYSTNRCKHDIDGARARLVVVMDDVAKRFCTRQEGEISLRRISILNYLQLAVIHDKDGSVAFAKDRSISSLSQQA